MEPGRPIRVATCHQRQIDFHSIVRGLSGEGLGVLALTQTIIGVASVLDFGIGRAFVQVVAKPPGGG